MRAAGRMRAAVLFSGTGSNLAAIASAVADGRLPLELCLAATDRPEAPGLARAASFGIPTIALAARDYEDRAAHERAMADAIDASGAQLVVLAGYMRIFGAGFVGRYAGRLLNLHPSLLPAYPGLHTHDRALAAGERLHGTSIHFVTPELDGGPLVAQAEVTVLPDDSADSLAARVRAAEHVLYPVVLGWFATGRLRLDGEIVCLDGLPLAQPVRFRAAETEPLS
jgi:phosphoribosylglycinamide formyltransferase 1